MAILVDEDTRLLVQGMTGREGSFHTAQMRAYGTNVVAGVTPGKGGRKSMACRYSTRYPRPWRRPMRTRPLSSFPAPSGQTRS